MSRGANVCGIDISPVHISEANQAAEQKGYPDSQYSFHQMDAHRLKIVVTMKKRLLKRQMVGTVVSDKMDKTVTVLVERLVKHRLYQKYIRRRSRFAAHDENNVSRVGDKVLISQSRPLSKTKRWRVSKIVEKAV